MICFIIWFYILPVFFIIIILHTPNPTLLSFLYVALKWIKIFFLFFLKKQQSVCTLK